MKKPIVLFTLATICAGAALDGAVVISEDFSTNKNGFTVADGTVIYSTYSRWGATGVNDPGQTITATTSAPSNAFTPTSTHALFYDDNTASGAANLRLKLENNTGGAVDPFTDDPLTISFDYYNVANAQTMFLFVGDSSGLNKLGLELFRPAGTVGQVYNGATILTATDGGNNWLNKNTWYRYILTIDNQLDTYDLSIFEAGNSTARYDYSGLNIQPAFGTDSDLGTITQIELQPFGNASGTGHEAYFDNLEITQVPEPATVALYAGFLALGLVMYRRHRF